MLEWPWHGVPQPCREKVKILFWIFVSTGCLLALCFYLQTNNPTVHYCNAEWVFLTEKVCVCMRKRKYSSEYALWQCFCPIYLLTITAPNNLQFLSDFHGGANEIPGGKFPLKWNGSLWAQRGWCQSATEQWTHTDTQGFSLRSLPARWLLCCFTASARQINVFVHVFHPLACGLKEQFAVVMLFADWGGHSPAWVWARKHRVPEEGKCLGWQQLGKGERKKERQKGWLGSQRSPSVCLLQYSHNAHTSFGIWCPVFASPAANLSSTLCPHWPDLRVGVCVPACHIPCCSPTWDCYSCLAAPGRLAQLLCSAGVSSKGNGNLAAAFSQSRRGPSWLQVMAKVLGLDLISLCK